jgi:hypothetical protein
MRSLPGRSRIHIRPGRYWAHEHSRLPANNSHPNIHIEDDGRRWIGDTQLACRRNTNVKLVEPPSCSSASPIVFVGKNSRGNWVAQEQNGRYGGLFVSRAQAVKYALSENGHHPETIVELSREIELDMSCKDLGGKLPFPAAGARRVA